MGKGSTTRKLLPISLALVTIMVTGAGMKAQATDRRPVSVTVGCVEIKNWEDNLVRNNPNLRHYHWNPMYSNVQAVQLVGPMAPPPMRGTSGPKKNAATHLSPKNVTFKPNQARPLFYKRPTDHRFAYNPSFYKRPVHLPPQRNTSTTSAYVHVPAGSDIQGKLIASQPANYSHNTLHGVMKPKAPGEIARAGKLNVPGEKNVHGTLAHRNVSGHLVHKDVQGELVARAVSATFVGNSAKMVDDAGARVYYPYASSHTGNVINNLTRARVDAHVAHPNRLRSY